MLCCHCSLLQHQAHDVAYVLNLWHCSFFSITLVAFSFAAAVFCPNDIQVCLCCVGFLSSSHEDDIANICDGKKNSTKTIDIHRVAVFQFFFLINRTRFRYHNIGSLFTFNLLNFNNIEAQPLIALNEEKGTNIQT